MIIKCRSHSHANILSDKIGCYATEMKDVGWRVKVEGVKIDSVTTQMNVRVSKAIIAIEKWKL